MASSRIVNLATAESVWFHSRTRKLTIQREDTVEILRLPEANTLFDTRSATPTILFRSSPSLTLECTEAQYAALRTAMIDPLVNDGSKL